MLKVLSKNTTIALYSSSNYLQLFYLCKVLDFESAAESMTVEYNYVISKGSKFIKCYYYKKQKELRSGIHYRLLPKSVFVFPL